MIALSFSKLIQESVRKESQLRQATGGIQSVEEFLDPDSLAALQRHHKGAFCFALYHSESDVSVAQYIQKGSVSADTGKRVLLLFLTSSKLHTAKRLKQKDLQFGIELDTSQHPSYELLSSFFPLRSPSVILPGLVICSSLIDHKNAVYVPLANLMSIESVAARCRHVFKIMEVTYLETMRSPEEFIDKCSVEFAKKDIPYERSDKISFYEGLIKAYKFVIKHRGDITAVASLG